MRINQTNNVPSAIETEKVSTEVPSTKPFYSNTIDVFKSETSTLKSHINGALALPNLSDQIKEDLKENGDEYKSSFQEFSKKQQESDQKLAELLRALNQIRSGNIKI
jgi:hypothetical protein